MPTINPSKLANFRAYKPTDGATELTNELKTKTIDNDVSDQFTVIEVVGLDRPGLLYEVTAAISDLNLDITFEECCVVIGNVNCKQTS